jgi:hypothetical protein
MKKSDGLELIAFFVTILRSTKQSSKGTSSLQRRYWRHDKLSPASPTRHSRARGGKWKLCHEYTDYPHSSAAF